MVAGAPVADGPGTVAEGEFDSGRPSTVQVAAPAEQPAVAASDTVTSPNEAGRTLAIYAAVLPPHRALHVHQAPARHLERPGLERREPQPLELLAEPDLQAEPEPPAVVVLGRHAVGRRCQRFERLVVVLDGARRRPIVQRGTRRARQRQREGSRSPRPPSRPPSPPAQSETWRSPRTSASPDAAVKSASLSAIPPDVA